MMKHRDLKIPKFQGKLPVTRAYRDPDRDPNPEKPPSHRMLAPDRGPPARPHVPERERRMVPPDRDRREARDKSKGPRDRVSAIDLAKVECFRCSRLGHLARDCPARLNYSRQEWNSYGRKPLKNTEKKP